jgi:signal transduction histidine kinase
VTPGETGSGARAHLDVVAHELRSPVAALDALAAAATTVPAVERARLTALAIAAARDIERILADPELFSLRLQPVDLGALVTALADDGISVTVTSPTAVVGDPTRIRQAVANLVRNGLRHGSVVAIEVGETDGWARVDVSDDGPGIEAGIDPFARGVSGVGSSGLGLWLARAVAEAHGGSLVVVTSDGPGARFRLALPLASGER